MCTFPFFWFKNNHNRGEKIESEKVKENIFSILKTRKEFKREQIFGIYILCLLLFKNHINPLNFPFFFNFKPNIWVLNLNIDFYLVHRLMNYSSFFEWKSENWNHKFLLLWNWSVQFFYPSSWFNLDFSLAHSLIQALTDKGSSCDIEFFSS